jgi:hypothetical protein
MPDAALCWVKSDEDPATKNFVLSMEGMIASAWSLRLWAIYSPPNAHEQNDTYITESIEVWHLCRNWDLLHN